MRHQTFVDENKLLDCCSRFKQVRPRVFRIMPGHFDETRQVFSIQYAQEKGKYSSVFLRQNFLFMERGKVVLYVTSLAVCRGPFLRCLEIRKIFHNLMVKFTECDLYMNREYQQDVRDRLGADKADGVPHLFIEGHYVGVSSEVHRLEVVASKSEAKTLRCIQIWQILGSLCIGFVLDTLWRFYRFGGLMGDYIFRKSSSKKASLLMHR